MPSDEFCEVSLAIVESSGRSRIVVNVCFLPSLERSSAVGFTSWNPFVNVSKCWPIEICSFQTSGSSLCFYRVGIELIMFKSFSST